MRKARVLVTQKCNRNCDGCCNKSNILDSMKVIKSIDELLPYDEIMITGGEPTLVRDKVITLFEQLKERYYMGNRLIYSATYDEDFYSKLIPIIDGLHFTLHYEATDKDVRDLRDLSLFLKDYLSRKTNVSENYKSFRVNIDKRLYERYDFSNIDFSPWGSVRKMEWIKDCPLPNQEELLYLDIEKLFK